jgi:Tfp pilus assembly protein PilX
MSDKKNSSNVIVVTEEKRSVSTVHVLLVLVIVALFVLSGVLAVYVQQNINSQNQSKEISSQSKQITILQNQLNQLESPKLISIGIQFTDNRSEPNAPFLRVSDYVVNVGTAEANNCKIYVTATQGENATALNTSAFIPSLEAGAFETIDLQFPYTGQALISYTSYLTWTT